MCVGYRKPNAVTVTNSNGLLLIKDILNSLQDKKISTTLDLKSGYHQLRLAPEAKKKGGEGGEKKVYDIYDTKRSVQTFFGDTL